MEKFTVTGNDAGRTLLKFLQRTYTGLPVSRIERALRQRDITINGQNIKNKSHILKYDDVIEIYGLDIQRREAPIMAPKITFRIVYEDDFILVVDKPEGVAMHGENNALDGQVLKYLDVISDTTFIPASIGRLDKITSGLVIYGKTYEAVRLLNESSKSLRKFYRFKSDLPQSERVEVKISHDENATREQVTNHGKEAITIFTVQGTTKIAELVTGRKHQIRATLAHMGYPIYGDTKYGGKRASRVFLHSWKIVITQLDNSLSYLNGKEFLSEPGWT